MNKRNKCQIGKESGYGQNHFLGGDTVMVVNWWSPFFLNHQSVLW